MAEKSPDVRSIVAPLLSQGHTPAEVERAVINELRRQTAGRWTRTSGDDWYEVYCCTRCGAVSLRDCPRATPRPEAPWLRDGGCDTRRTEITVTEWEARHNRHHLTARDRRTEKTARRVAVPEAPQPAVQLRMEEE